jgi:hypothetical protein
LRGYSGDEVRASFLWSEPHMRSILQRPEGSFVAIICIRIRRREQGVSAFGNVGGSRRLSAFGNVGGSRGFQPPGRKQKQRGL